MGTGNAAASTKAMPPTPQKPNGFNTASSQIVYLSRKWRIFFKIRPDRHHPASSSSCWVAVPSSSVRAWGMRGSTASSEPLAPRGLPGRFTIRDRPRVPERERLRGANRRLLPALAAHQFREPLQQAVADGPGRLGGNVSRGYAGAAGCNHQTCHLALLTQRVLNFPLLVRHYQLADHAETIRLKQLGNRRARDIHPLSPEAGVAHGNDSGSHHK